MVEDINFHFLGTSDSVPSDSRNHPAFWLSYRDENILVDCGEGAQRQIRKAGLNPCKVTRILITHWHGDHTLGLPGLLKTLSVSDFPRTLYIYGPKGIKKHFREMDQAFGEVHEFKIVVEEVSGKFLEKDDFYIEAKPMEHGTPTNAYSFVVNDRARIDKKKLKEAGLPPGPQVQKLKEGKDVSYEGKKYKAKDLTYIDKGKKVSFVLDTKYNPQIYSLIKNSDLFVSECTYGSDLKDQAKEYMHLCADQVGKVSKRANAGKVALVHLSQRYQKNRKKILDEVKEYFDNAFLANDLDRVVV